MVGNVKVCELDIIEKLKFEEEICLFAKFPIGATMQDGSKRKEAMTMVYHHIPCNKLLKLNNKKTTTTKAGHVRR